MRMNEDEIHLGVKRAEGGRRTSRVERAEVLEEV